MATTKKAASKKSSSKSTPTSAADKIDEQLALYRDMRDFEVTSEPSGQAKAKGRDNKASWMKKEGLPFVIQKHAASHLHYDFRLGWNGVLKSWACAKGPSYNPKDRRLAVEVEDHPMEYGGFEGIIPKGQYGGGTVMIWDQGTWAPQEGQDVDEGLRSGSLKFVMNGTKMHGKWTLVRMKNSLSNGRWKGSTKPNWLLIKEHDDFERGPDDPAVIDEMPKSSLTDRTMDEIAKQEDHVWNSKETGSEKSWYRQDKNEDAAETKKPARKAAKKTKAATSSAIDALPKEQQPDFVKPQLAQETTGPPEAQGWLHELKLDGYRIQARKAGDTVQLLTRKGLDWTHRMPAIAMELKDLSAESATLDGEVVVLAEDGTTSFAALQASFQEGEKNPLTYFAFDLLHLNGHSTRSLPLIERKALLKDILLEDNDTVRFSDHIETGGEEMFHKACELHAEGIISKRASGRYVSGRTNDWLKSKCLREQEFVIGGFTPSAEGPDKIGSLLLGYYRNDELIYAGRTGTGFTQKSKRALRSQLAELETRTVPFYRPPSEARRDAHWVEPKLVAQVRFATWTADDVVRQAAFLGLREDKSPREVHREEPTVAPKPKAFDVDRKNHAPKKASSEAAHATSASHAARVQPRATAADTMPTKHAASAKPLAVKPRPTMRLTHPTKVLDPESGLTKAQLADYYWAVAELMLPHVADRPLSLVRCPEGAGKPCFFQKHVNHMLPPGVFGVDVPDKKTGVPEPYITLNTTEALAGMAQMGVLEVHPWGSRNEDLEHPDRLIFDLDPDESLPWDVLCHAAGSVRSLLTKLGLKSFLKTTGGKGLHLVTPIVPQHDWPQIKEFAHRVVLKMERENPMLYLTKMTKAARKGKIYLDYLRNERGATAVAPYSPRARAGAHVSLPLPWAALKLPERPVFTVHDFPEWSSRLRSDPWKEMSATKQTLDLKSITSL